MLRKSLAILITTIMIMLLAPSAAFASDSPPIVLEIRASQPGGVDYIVCRPTLTVRTSGGQLEWDARIPCDGSVGDGSMEGLYVTSRATKVGAPSVFGPTDYCGTGTVTDFAGLPVIWSGETCAPDSLVVSEDTCATCTGEWLVPAKFALVFPLTYNVELVTQTGCRLELPRKAYCEVVGYGNLSGT